jgi:hypothetical protein
MVEAAARLTESLPRTIQGEPFLKIEVESFGDEEAFVAKMREFLRDRRRIGQDDWDILMKSAFAAARREAVSRPSLWQMKSRPCVGLNPRCLQYGRRVDITRS